MKNNNYTLVDGDKPFLIAEVGINHNGDINLAKETILEASKSGASAVKIQTFKAESFCQKNSKYYELFKSVELNEDQLQELYNYSKRNNIKLFSSVFDYWSIDLNCKLGAPLLKIASGDITHIPLIEYASKKNLPIIMSTGASTMQEIDNAITAAYKKNTKLKLALLHCVSKYPSKPEECNLNCIPIIKEKFNLETGFSDHTIGAETAISAVALGANIIEKHFTLDKSLEGPDHILSSNPEEFKNLSRSINLAFKARGSMTKKPVEGLETIKQLRRSLFASKKIKKNSLINESMIVISRPAIGLEPRYLKNILGKKASADIKEGEPIIKDKINFKES